MPTLNFDTAKAPIALSAPPLDHNYVRAITGWQVVAATLGTSKGQHAAEKFARMHGFSCIVWGDGHVTMFLKNKAGGLTRLQFEVPESKA